MTETATERSMRTRRAAHILHATHDSKKLTENARKAFADRFERLADPDGKLTDEERRRRAGHLKKAHFTDLALKSARARRERAAVKA